MDPIEIIRLNVFSPMVMAFVLGIIAVLVKSDLRIPEQVYSIISIYLLFAIGLKGGFDLAKSSLSDFWGPAGAAVIIGALIPIWSTFILRRFGGFDLSNAAALGIHFGAVSAVTLSAAVTFLGEVNEPFEGFMPTMYAIMEIPAIAIGLLIAQRGLAAQRLANGSPAPPTEEKRREPTSDVVSAGAVSDPDHAAATSTWELLREALTGKSFLLLGGGVLIGFISGDTGARQVSPFFVDLFPGMLTLFLLEMGTLVGHRLKDLRDVGVFLVGFSIVMPILHGLLGVVLGGLAGLSVGGAMILGTLAASASYITAPAVVQTNLPDANPGYYLTAALVITFPFNLVVGLPLYFEFAELLVR